MMTFLWVAVIILAVFCEAQTASLVAIWFMPAAFVALILSICRVDIWIQVLVFFVLSFALIALFKSLFKKASKAQKIIPTNAEILIGKTCIVTEKIDNIQGSGSVRVMSQVWTARALEDSTILDPGKVAIVREIRGVKLIVEPDNKKI